MIAIIGFHIKLKGMIMAIQDLNRLKEYRPARLLVPYIDAYWSFRNTTGKTITFPVVPDGCSDIIFYLNNSKTMFHQKTTFVTGIMEYTQLVTAEDGMESFGIRFKPGMLYYLIQSDMHQFANDRAPLTQFNQNLEKQLTIDPFQKDETIVKAVDKQLVVLFQSIVLQNNFHNIIASLITNPQLPINECAEQYGYSLKNLQRVFNKRIGITPKKFARIMRFQKAHKKLSKEGLKQLVMIALTSGYFDQAHFNREYKELVGCNPSNETMSILYNK